jgi:peptidoglycan pentaglycine glycine transferase (the first glycine)
MPEVSSAEWQSFLREHPRAHLLQTAEWGELKAAFGWQPVRLVSAGQGLQILFRRLPFGFSLGYIPKGPAGESGWLDGSPALWAELDQLCRDRRAAFCKLEPDAWQGGGPVPPGPGWRPSPHAVQPPRTLVVDLEGSEADILARMKQKTRYNIRLAAKKGVTVRPWQDLAAFHAMMEITGARDGFGVHNLAYYRRTYELFHPAGACELLLAEFEGRPLAALMVFARGPRAWYFYGASGDEERSRMPTYLLQWEAMRWARARGCGEYDLWGVPDEDEETLESGFIDRSDGLWGVYRFKRGFGGRLQRAARSLDRIYNPVLYALYRLRMGRGEAA